MDTRGATPFGVQGVCPDSETLAAFVDGRLDAAQRDEVAAHVNQCSDCGFVVREARQAGGRPLSPSPGGRPARFTAPVLAALTAALVLATFFLSRC